MRLNFFNYAVARGNSKFVKYFLEELDKVLGGPAGGHSANTSIVKNSDLPKVNPLKKESIQYFCLFIAWNIALIKVYYRAEKIP